MSACLFLEAPGTGDGEVEVVAGDGVVLLWSAPSSFTHVSVGSKKTASADRLDGSVSDWKRP